MLLLYSFDINELTIALINNDDGTDKCREQIMQIIKDGCNKHNNVLKEDIDKYSYLLDNDE